MKTRETTDLGKIMCPRIHVPILGKQPLILQFCAEYIFFAYLSLLILFLTQELALSQHQSYEIMAFFLGSNYILHCITASLINKWITYSLAIFQGLILNFIGITFLLFATGKSLLWLYFSLSFIILSNSFLQLGILIFTSDLYKKNTRLYQTTFTKNQVIMNIGSIFGPMASGVLCYLFNVRIAIFSMQVFVFLTMVIFCLSFPKIHNTSTSRKNQITKNISFILILAVVLCLGLMFLKDIPFQLIGACHWIIISGIIFYLFKKRDCQNLNDRTPIFMFFVNIICILFFTIFNQINGPLILFTQEYTAKTLYHFDIPVQWFLSLESIFVILIAFFLKKFKTSYTFFEKLSTAGKLSLSMLLISLAFAMLTIVGFLDSSSKIHKINALWLLPFYLLISLSELAFVPTVLSYLSKTISARPALLSLGFGYFFVSKGSGAYLSMSVAKAILGTQIHSDQQFHQYIFMFSALTILASIISIAIFLVGVINTNLRNFQNLLSSGSW